MRNYTFAMAVILLACGTDPGPEPKSELVTKPLIREGACKDIGTKFPSNVLLQLVQPVEIWDSIPAFHAGTMDIVLLGLDTTEAGAPACEFFRAQLTHFTHAKRTQATLTLTLPAMINAKLKYHFDINATATADSGGAAVKLFTSTVQYFPSTQTKPPAIRLQRSPAEF